MNETTINAAAILQDATEAGASDIFIVAGLPLSYRVNGVLFHKGERLMPDSTEAFIRQIYELTHTHPIDDFLKNGDDDFSFAIRGLSRFRVSTYKQRGSLAAVIRVITFELPNPAELGIPDAVMGLSEYTKGMVLVTGPAGSGKSTTLACLVDRINSTKQDHIITLEDPLEYLHHHKESIVSQREISTDTENYLVALRAALRQSPDVILLGEMRDFETIQTAMTAAETGHLVLSSLHTIGAANTISRIIDVFDASQQRQIAVQLSMVLKAVVSQQLVPAKNGTLVPAFEIMVMTPAISNMIRDNKVHQIDGIIYTSAKEDMISMDNSLLELYRKGIITQETVLQYCTNPEMTRKKL
ncbi:MAG: PilT/PilU family type 4a pilus ATPase [Lachnospiraceae bacterium]|nr:Twitching mobility protein [uncultured Clostridium sp.]